MANYSIVIQWSDDDKGYIATVPEFQTLSAFGETPEEALKELKVAQNALIEVYEEDGCPLPEPDKMRTYSGQTRIRIEKSLHSALVYDAKTEGVSLNAHINNILERRYRHQNKEGESILKQIQLDISSIKSEINDIKTNIKLQLYQKIAIVQTSKTDLFDVTSPGTDTEFYSGEGMGYYCNER